VKRAWLAVPALVLALAGCKSGSSLPNYGMVPDFELVDQNGRAFRNGEQLRGRVWVANMIFTSCMGPCPRMTAQMRQVRDATSNSPDRALVTLTIDPARDTPEVLAAYAKRANAGPSWHFLTGPMRELDHLAYDVFHLGHIDGTLEHSTRFVLVDRHERIRGYYDSSDPANIKALIADIATLEKSGD
jgi:protein SCO1